MRTARGGARMTTRGQVRTATRGRARTTTALTAVAFLTASLAGCQTPRDTSPGDLDEPTAIDSDDTPVSSDDRPSTTPTEQPPTEPAAPITADLTIVVDATGEGATETYTLTCAPDGGDHPDPAAACAAIAAAGGADAFAPTPRDVECTEQWGGPQVATVEGTVDGTRIDATFDRRNGCEIFRWDNLAALLGAGLM